MATRVFLLSGCELGPLWTGVLRNTEQSECDVRSCERELSDARLETRPQHTTRERQTATGKSGRRSASKHKHTAKMGVNSYNCQKIISGRPV
eukprot:5507976-Pleurochrysis_carterae.AAC.2